MGMFPKDNEFDFWEKLIKHFHFYIGLLDWQTLQKIHLNLFLLKNYMKLKPGGRKYVAVYTVTNQIMYQFHTHQYMFKA